MLTFLKYNVKIYLYRIGIILFILLSFLGRAFTQSYNFRNFNTENGLAQGYIYSIIQDARGYLWIGTGNGLSRYNGLVFENFTTSDSLADNFITCGINDGGSMWFGHMNGRLSYFNGKRLQAINLPDSSAGPITHFTKSPDGQIWLSSYSDGLFKLDKEIRSVEKYSSEEQSVIITFEFLNNREFLAGTNTGLLHCRIKYPDQIEIIQAVKDFPESKVSCIKKMRSDPGFFIATENEGIFQLRYENKEFKISKIIVSPEIDFTGIQDIYEDSHSDLWLASYGKGLIKMSYAVSGELTGINYFNTSVEFPTDNVKTIYEDREGIIWSGNYGDGLTQITPKTFSVYKFNKQLYGNDIFSIYNDQKYKWIGTENGLIKTDLFTGRIVNFYGKGSGLPKDTVTSIFSTDGKELWIGTESNGVFRMEVGKEKILKFPIGNGVLENSVTIITGKKEQVWIGTKKGLCNINLDLKSINWYSISKGGLPHNFIKCLYIDREDRLWVSSHSNILAYIHEGKVIKIPLSSGGGVLTLGPITEDTDSRIWVGSYGNGVFMLGSDSIANLTVKEGLLFNYCYSLISDDHNNIWIGHKGGLSRIRTTDFSIKPIQQFENITDNYQFNPNSIAKDQQGKICFGSYSGIVCYDPAMEINKNLPPVLGITSIRINDEEKDYADKIILSPGTYKIKIDFLGVSLKEPALVSYQYILEGLDQSYEITRIPTVEYKQLTDGDYTFTLKASSGDGAVSKNAVTINFIIKKPVWKKWWFYPLVVLFLMILTFVYIKRREYEFLAEKRILEEKVRQRTFEIQSQKNEIELQRDLIDEKNANITSSIRYARHIQNAVLPPIELLNKLLPDNFILSLPKDIVSGDFYWMAERDNKIIFTVADCTGHGVPGAFMSLLGVTLLNEVVNIQGITRSDAIVEKLRESIIQSLQQTRKDMHTYDGMDIALCVLDREQNKIQFTGGMNNLVYIRNRNLEVVKADYLSVCYLDDNFNAFTMKEINLRKGDIFYLFSDGYQDQFGGLSDKKYLCHRLYRAFLDIHELPMKTQRDILEKNLKDWMKDTVQTDDITVMGVRF